MTSVAVTLSLHLGSLTPMQSLGIPVSLIGSVFLALGAEFQHAGVRSRAGEPAGGRLGGVQNLLGSPVWLLGTGLQALSIVFQLVSLALAPLTVVQPLGAAALVITALLNARATKSRLDRAAVRAIGMCVIGIGLFVTVAAVTTSSRPVHTTQLIAVLVILGIVLLAISAAVLALRSRLGAIGFVFGAGILFGFVATLAKVVIDRIQTLIAAGSALSSADWLTAACLLGMAAAGGLGMYLVQKAYAVGQPDLVVAGLTVVDPMVGVTIGIVVLGEATGAPLWAIPIFAVAAVTAVVGVLKLARHPARVALKPDVAST
jgi:drug/metabolite transporter (DMT)-like permease